MSKQEKDISLFKTTLFTKIVYGFFLINSVACLGSYSAAEIARFRQQKSTSITNDISKEICETRGCIHAASEILDYMDPTVNPCNDFYQFSCGKFIKETFIPDDKAKVDNFNVIDDKLQQDLRVGIESKLNADDPRTFKLLQTYYNTCMNTDQIEKTSEKDFRDILNKLGGWPVLEGNSWDNSTFDWKKSVYKSRQTGYSINNFISFEVAIDMKNNSRQILQLDQAALGLQQEFLSKGLDEKVVQAYFKYMIDFAEILGVNREQAKKELADSLDFEIKLAKISLPNEKRRDMEKLYNPMRVSELESQYPGIPWMEYANDLLAPHTRLQSDETVIVVVPSYLQEFSKLVASTPSRVLANYAMWRVASASAGKLGERFQKAETEFQASLTGTSVKEPRWKECVSHATGSLELAAGALYVRRYFDESARTNAQEMIENIRKSFHKLISEVNWMDEKTRNIALEKLAFIQPYIAYPSEFFDNKALDEYHQYLKFYPESYLKSQLNLRLFNLAYEFDQLRKPVNKTDWITHGMSAIVNAFYEPSENSIQFPAGILQGVFFRNDRPKYLNYGGIGFVMGHEFTHGFDDQGRQYDKYGNVVEWWEPETKEKFQKRAQCIIDQYSNYTVKQVGLKINGINTQGENIADNGGIKEAYFAYNDWEKRNGQEPRLPGLPYSSQQMFWISAANVWCSKFRSEALKARIVTDVHSPGEFRVIGPLSNMPEFSRDFNCPLGSPMNPAKKCTVW